MRINHYSTYALNSIMRESILERQKQLGHAQQELATGVVHDMGLKLGSQTSLAATIDGQKKTLNQLQETNGLLESRLTLMQASLSAISEAGDNFFNAMTVQMTVIPNGKLMETAGDTLLGLASNALNATLGGEYVFSGINTDQLGLVDYDGSDGPDPATAVRDAFEDHFGFLPDSASAQSITTEQMDAFIDGDFADLFSDSNWEDLWSGAADRGIRSRISQREIVETQTTAYDKVFRDVVSAAVLVKEFSTANLNDGARMQIVKRTANIVAVAGKSLNDQIAVIGMVEERIGKANDRIDTQKNVLDHRGAELVGVDPFVAATRINELKLSLESSYMVTSRIQKLSLLNFL